jgi:hypothetical protein
MAGNCTGSASANLDYANGFDAREGLLVEASWGRAEHRREGGGAQETKDARFSLATG